MPSPQANQHHSRIHSLRRLLHVFYRSCLRTTQCLQPFNSLSIRNHGCWHALFRHSQRPNQHAKLRSYLLRILHLLRQQSFYPLWRNCHSQVFRIRLSRQYHQAPKYQLHQPKHPVLRRLQSSHFLRPWRLHQHFLLRRESKSRILLSTQQMRHSQSHHSNCIWLQLWRNKNKQLFWRFYLCAKHKPQMYILPRNCMVQSHPLIHYNSPIFYDRDNQQRKIRRQ